MIRNLFTIIDDHINDKEFSIIVGARQTGKSTLLKQLLEHYKAMSKPIIFLNLENKMILEQLDASPLNLLSYIDDREERTIVLIDEIQYLTDPSHFLKLLYDDYAPKLKIVATGSSAFYIDSKFKDSLAGRKRIFYMPTCSFDEYLQLRGHDDMLQEVKRMQRQGDAKSLMIDLLRKEWDDYMIYGGYPAVITESRREDKIARLEELRDAFVQRDIMESNVRDKETFYRMFRILASQSGNLLNTSELANTLRIKHETATNYLYVLRKCFHVSLVTPFYRNLRKELTKMPKVFMADTGMQNCLLGNFTSLDIRIDKGMLWETIYYKLLCEQHSPEHIHYWRTSDNNEVDFIITDTQTPTAIEAKYDIQAVKESKYDSFRKAYPEIALSFAWLSPFDENFFRRLNKF